tara:strand:- start:9999 stop:10646 length:648 start_codon:yes stop_codon:yes gene_type:complete
MDIHMQLIRKGVKAKKKRLAGSGGGGGGSLVGTKLIAMTSKALPSMPNNYSTVEMTVRDMTNGTIYVDVITGIAINGMAVQDMVAHQNGLVSSPAITNGTINLSAGIEYRIDIAAFLHPNMTGSGTESAACLPITDVGNNFNNGNIQINPALGTLTSPYKAPYGGGFSIDILNTAVAGELIIQIANLNGGSDTNSNVIAGSASVSDAYHFKIIIT